MADPHSHLHTLLVLYAQGHSAPLHFYPRTSWMQAERPASDTAARTIWAATPHKPFTESVEPYNRLALRGVPDPLDQNFRDLAQTVYFPVQEHLRDHPGNSADLDGPVDDA